MPISGPSSYVPTINEFLGHWTDVNTTLGGSGPLVLPGAIAIATLTTHRDSLLTYAASIQSKLNDTQISRGTIDIKKAGLLTRLAEFNRKVRGFLAHTAYVQGLPEVPPPTAGQGPTLEPLDDMESLWGKINAATIPGFTGPLTLLGGYVIATFTTDLASLKSEYTAWQGFDQDVTLERERRNGLQDKVSPILRDYRAAVEGTFAPTDALVVSLPRLSPIPGATPPAVTANISWDATQSKAKITWSESTIANLAQYEIRFCPGANYSTDTETVIGNVSAGSLREFLTDAGLSASGNVASFKVYVITTDGNEKGSNTLVMTRP
jgi:hypothetical protein